MTSVITQSPDILSGTPVFRGTRVPVQNLIDYLLADETVEAFLADFPTVSHEQVVSFLVTAQTAHCDRVCVVEFCG